MARLWLNFGGAKPTLEKIQSSVAALFYHLLGVSSSQGLPEDQFAKTSLINHKDKSPLCQIHTVNSLDGKTGACIGA